MRYKIARLTFYSWLFLMLSSKGIASPIKKGLNDGLVTSYYMSLLSHVVYRVDSDLDRGSKAKLKRLGLKACEGTSVLKLKNRDFNSVALLLTDRKNVFVIFRGTKNLDDVITDIKYYVVPRVELGDGVLVHKGFNQFTQAFIKKFNLMSRAKRCLQGGQLYIAGHSLGGAVANLFAAEATRRHLAVGGVYTFGAPRVGGSKWRATFQTLLGSRTYQWIHPNDPVPRLPKGSLKRGWTSGLERIIANLKGQTFVNLRQIKTGQKDGLRVLKENLNPFDGKGSLSYHAIKGYAYDIWERYRLEGRVHKSLHPTRMTYDGSCNDNRECRAGEHCSTVGKNRCISPRPLGAPCLRGQDCLSNRCKLLKCVAKDACTRDEQCGPHSFCKKSGSNRCVPRLPLGARCIKSRHCQSQKCKLFKCVKLDACTKDQQCGLKAFCKKTGVNRCVSLLPTGARCLKSRHCESGKCALFKCR